MVSIILHPNKFRYSSIKCRDVNLRVSTNLPYSCLKLMLSKTVKNYKKSDLNCFLGIFSQNPSTCIDFSSTSLGRNGLVKYKSAPTSMPFCLSNSCPLAVNMTIYTSFICKSCLTI